jgi:hypothetical protein
MPVASAWRRPTPPGCEKPITRPTRGEPRGRGAAASPRAAGRSPAPRLLALVALLASTVGLSAQPPTKADAKADPAKDAKPLVVKLPDGTFLWLGSGEGERVTLTPEEFQKLLDRADALKKELAARKPAAPSGCAVRGSVQKRGEQLVAALKLTYTFRTAQPNAAVALGGRKAFLVGAALDGANLPVLDAGEDGFAVAVEAAGEHTLVLDAEAPVTARGAKAEVGFELGLPRAPITTLALDAPPGAVKRVTLTTRAPDLGTPPKAPDVRRLAGLDVKQLAGAGVPLGPVESLEVTWEPPAAVAQPADQVQSAELDVAAVLTDGFIESTARVRLRGPGREWKLVAPAAADVSVDRGPAPAETGPTQPPVVAKPPDPTKPVWRIEFPVGSSAADWTVTAVVRQSRPKSGPKAAVPVGPFAVLDVLRQTGTVRVTAAPHTRFVFRHGPDLRRAEASGIDDDANSVALFRLATGPTGAAAAGVAPLCTVEAWPVEGAVRVKPAYKLKLTEAGWHVTAEVAVKPIRTEVDALDLDVPADWRGLESLSEPDLVTGVSQGKADGAWLPVTVRLAAGQRQPFVVVLVATVPLPPGAREAVVTLPRFPRATERDAAVTATVPDGLEVRGTARGWDGDAPAAWTALLGPVPGPDGKPPRVVTAVTGRVEGGLARANLLWQPYRPDVSAAVRADVSVGDRQVDVAQVVKLRAPDGWPRPLKLRGPADATGLSARIEVPGAPARAAALDAPAAGVWTLAPPADAKEATLRLSYALPLPAPAPAGGPLAAPAGLLWAADAARTDAHVRVWVNSVAGRTVAGPAAGWRELPPEPAPDRDALPALTLAASAERPLVLEVRADAADGGAAVEVRRALIEAGPTGDGPIGYRARFRIERWLTPAVEVGLPAGAAVTATLDGAAAPVVPVGEGDGGARYRVALPEAAPGRTVVLELLYTLPGLRGAFADTLYTPPRLAGAAFAGVRWLVTEPPGSAPLVLSGGRTELRWRGRDVTYAPAAPTRAAVDRWFVFGTDPDPTDAATGAEGESVLVHQAVPDAVRVARGPWLVLVTGCSLAVVLAFLALAWLPATAAGLFVASLGGVFGACAVLYPQVAAQAVAAGQPGAAVGLAAVAVVALIRWDARRRVTHLPGFTRTPPGPRGDDGAGGTPAVPPSARGRPGSSGGTPAPVAPSGSGS